jgi:glutamine synthetase adenylyltransferase
MVNDAQTHSLPIEWQELAACARRLGYSDNDLGTAVEQLLRDYQRHTGQVNRIFEEIFSVTEPRRFSRLNCQMLKEDQVENCHDSTTEH